MARAAGPARRAIKATRAALAALSFLAASSVSAATIRVGPNEVVRKISEAARLARDGDIVEIQAADYRGDVAVWRQRRLVIRGIGQRPVLNADGKSAEGKAIWVIRDGDFQIDNIEFRGARVTDANGAGIRLESGRLAVSNCSFIDNQTGILTSNAGDAELRIRDSLFADAPREPRSLPHLLYVGRIRQLTVTGSRFHNGYRGHLIKSRAHRNDIRYNLIADGPDGHSSYEIDLPNGGTTAIVGNIVEQSADTENPVVIAYGAEGETPPESRLYLAHNTLISKVVTGGWFLRVWPGHFRTPPQVIAINNLTVGLGIFALGATGDFRGNHSALPWMLGGTSAFDFTLPADSPLRGHTADPEPVAKAAGQDLVPIAEFSWPIGTRPLATPGKWAPGAYQTQNP